MLKTALIIAMVPVAGLIGYGAGKADGYKTGMSAGMTEGIHMAAVRWHINDLEAQAREYHRSLGSHCYTPDDVRAHTVTASVPCVTIDN